VDVATLAAGGSGLDVSRLRGLAAVAVARGGATGATAGTSAGKLRGAAGGSAITGPLNGGTAEAAEVAVGATWAGASVGTGDGEPVTTAASGSTGAVGTDVVGNARAESDASSSWTRWSTIVLPSPSKYPPHASKNRPAAIAYCTRCQSLRSSYQ
jgi:hypothetical protein